MKVRGFILLAGLMFFLGIVQDLHAQYPLTYSISLIERNGKNNTLVFKTTIKNISDSDVVIDKHGNNFLDVEKCVERNYTNSSFELNAEDMSIIADGHTPDYLKLPPKGIYSDRRILSLSSSNIFEKGRRYSISFRYESATPFRFEGTDVWIGTIRSMRSDLSFSS